MSRRYDMEKDNKSTVIHLSFKNDKQDRELYEWIIKHNGKSYFIKNILRNAMEKELNNNNK
jgi:hypothetical protein